MKTEVENLSQGQLGPQPPPTSIKSGAVSLWVAQVSRRGIRLLFLLFAARLLGPAHFGLYALLLTITEMVSILTGGGFGDYITRELARLPETAFHIATRITQLRWIYSTIVGLLMMIILRSMGYDRSVLIMAAIMVLSLFPRAILETCQGSLKAAERFKWYTLSELVQGLALFSIGIPLLRVLGISGAVFTELAAVSIAALAALIPTLRIFPRNRNAHMPSWRSTVRNTVAFNLYPLVAQVYDRVDVILLSKLASNSAVGIYGLPYKLYASLQILPFGIFGTILPRLSRSDWKIDTQQMMSRVLDLLFNVSLFIVLVVTLFAAPATQFALGDAYQGSATALKILIWASVPMFLNYGLNTVLLANRREKIFIVTATVCMLVNVAGNVLLIPHYSYRAAAAVTVMTEIVLLAQNLYWVFSKLGRTLLSPRMLISALIFFVSWVIAIVGPRYFPVFVAESLSLLLFGTYLFQKRESLRKLS
jgi:O-antigen/teichoic acid export membrane protein